MNISKVIIIFILTAFSANTWAYGSSSSSKKACNKPNFTQFTPAHLEVVQPQSKFSLLISASVDPETIKVSVKKIAVDVAINKINNSYQVSGVLPESLTNTYARVVIKATGINSCKGDAGWLLKIES
jgi:hypothetical protein